MKEIGYLTKGGQTNQQEEELKPFPLLMEADLRQPPRDSRDLKQDRTLQDSKLQVGVMDKLKILQEELVLLILSMEVRHLKIDRL